MSGFLLPLCSVVFSGLLCCVYFLKKRINLLENNIYAIMLVASFIDSILVSILQLIAVNGIAEKAILYVRIFNKLDFIALITISTCLFLYSLLITININKATFKKIMNIIIPINIIAFFLLIILNINLITFEGNTSINGSSANITYIVCAAYLILATSIPLFNIKKTTKRHIPIYSVFFITFLLLIIYQINPYLIVVSISLTFINYLMYFTIENPDVKLLEQISLAKDHAEKAKAAKTDFLSNMSHEIRTPLNAIVGFSEAIQDETSLEDAKQDAKDIILASQNLLEIVNGILDISKIEANKMEIINSEYNLKEECESIAKLIKPRIGEKPIEFKMILAKDIPDKLYGDKGKVKEIILNLLTNAVKYTETGMITFKIDCINKNNESSLVISIEDTGRGIKANKIDKLFTKFERLEEDRNTTIEGAGLGLAITKSLVEMMDGKIIVQSVFGSGSKFTVYLKQKIIIKNELKYENKSIKDKSVIDLTGKRILIVDDNLLNIKVAEKMLGKYHAIVESCDSGMACVEKIENGANYDLILMDDMMPKMSGTETLHILKDKPAFRMKVIALTANAIEGMKDKYIEAGFDDYLAKPIALKDLENILIKWINNEIVKNDFEPLPDDFYEISENAVSRINEEVIEENIYSNTENKKNE